MKRIVALRKPTAPVRPPMGRGILWRLVSHLSLNYLSLVNEGKDALQEILRLYDLGAQQARGFVTKWRSVRTSVDLDRHQAVMEKLRKQAEDAAAWRDKCVAYFRQVSGT